LVDSVDADMPEYRVGKRYALDLVFWENVRDSLEIQSSSGGTAGSSTAETGFTLGGENTDGTPTGATTGSIQGEGSQVSRYEAVREYTRYAGRYAAQESIHGNLRISEHTPADASVESIIVLLQPDTGLTATDGLWIALDDVNDATRYPEDLARLSIRFRVLARGDQYANRADLKADLGSDLA